MSALKNRIGLNPHLSSRPEILPYPPVEHMEDIMRSALVSLSLVAVLLFSVLPAKASEPVDTAQSIIADQISAFRANDAVTAHSFAAPSIKALYPDPNRFIAMVRNGYAPVFRQSNYAFGRSKVSDDGGKIVQEVLISDTNGDDWTALYFLESQPDGSWKINGVQMVKKALPQT